MNKHAAINDLLNRRFDKSPVQVWRALVKSIEGNTCTVDVLGVDLVDVPGVGLLADDEAEGMRLVPRVGSLVYVSALENSLDRLFVCAYSEVDSLTVTIGKATLQLTADAATLSQGRVVVSLEGGKASVYNDSVSLVDLFSDLNDLLTSLVVITPVQGVPTPSTALDPGTIASLKQLTSKVNQLLQ